MAAFRGMHVSPAKHSFGKCDRRTDRQTDGQTDDGQSDPYVSLCFAGDTKSNSIVNIVAAFLVMHVLPAKHSYAWLPSVTTKMWIQDRQTDRQSDAYMPLCFAGDTKTICKMKGNFLQQTLATCSSHRPSEMNTISIGVVLKERNRADFFLQCHRHENNYHRVWVGNRGCQDNKNVHVGSSMLDGFVGLDIEVSPANKLKKYKSR